MPEKFRQAKSKMPIIFFGNGMFGKVSVKIKGLRTYDTGVLWRQLKRNQRSDDILLAYIDEFHTSKTCHSCNKMSYTETCICLNSVFTCQSCGMMWQRDVNAAKSIFNISKVISDRNRPLEFCRSK